MARHEASHTCCWHSSSRSDDPLLGEPKPWILVRGLRFLPLPNIVAYARHYRSTLYSMLVYITVTLVSDPLLTSKKFRFLYTLSEMTSLHSPRRLVAFVGLCEIVVQLSSCRVWCA